MIGTRPSLRHSRLRIDRVILKQPRPFPQSAKRDMYGTGTRRVLVVENQRVRLGGDPVAEGDMQSNDDAADAANRHAADPALAATTVLSFKKRNQQLRVYRRIKRAYPVGG